MRKRNPLKEQNGIALVLVMITFMIVAVLGTAVATAAMNENKQAAALNKDMQAYYKAHSAADVVITAIQKEIDAIKVKDDAMQALIVTPGVTQAQIDAAVAEYNALVAEFNKMVPVAEGKANAYTATVNNIAGIDSIQVYRQGIYIICEANATVNSMSSKAKVRIEQSSSGDYNSSWSENVEIPMFSEAIYANNDLTFNGNSNIVRGDVLYEGDLQNRLPNTPGYSCAQTLTDRPYPVWNPPSGLATGKTWSNTITSANNGVYNAVTISNTTTIRITTSATDVVLHIKQLTFSKPISIIATGTGRVFLFVDNIDYSGGNSNLTIASSTLNVPNVFLILKDDMEFKLAGNEKFQCYLYAPEQNITFSGTPNIYGSVISNNFISNGNIDFTYNPSSLDDDGPTIEQTVEHPVTYYRLGNTGANSKNWLPED